MNWSLNAPVSEIAGTLSATVPVISPNTRPGTTKIAPEPPLTVSTSVAPSPRASVTLVAPTRTTSMSSPPFGTPFAPSDVTCSKAKSPLSVWPSAVRTRPRPSTRTYGPAGRSRSKVSRPTLSRALTAAFVLLMRRLRLPLKLTPPGTFRATAPRISPANPALVTRKAPAPLVSATTSVVSALSRNVTLVATRLVALV